MGQNQTSSDRSRASSLNPSTYPRYSVNQQRLILLEEQNRREEEEIERQRQKILKEREDEAITIIRQEKERQEKKIFENERKAFLKALEEETYAKKKAIIEKERFVREKDRQVKEQQRIIQIQREELEKHKEITKNVLENVVQRQTKPAARFNHQYNFNDKHSACKVETKLQNMQIGSKERSAGNENKPRELNKKVNDVRNRASSEQWSNDQKSVRHEPETRQNLPFRHQQMFNQPPNFQNSMLHTMRAYPPYPQSFCQNMTYPTMLANDPRFTNVNVPSINLPQLTPQSSAQQSATNMHANNQNTKQNSSHRNKVYQKTVSKRGSRKKSLTDGSKREEQDSDSDQNSPSVTKNQTRRRRRYGRTKVSTNENLTLNETAKAEQLDCNAKKPDTRMIGQFQCPQCSKSWKSATTYIGVTQQCSRCRIDVAPTKLESMRKHREDLCGKCKELGRNCREKTNKPTKVPGEKENIDDISD